MEVTEFEIDGFIGEWGYSNRYVKSYLNSSDKKPVICRVCSGGGDFLMAMNIKDEFARHGNVTVDISGFAASAATIIGLGAKTTRMSNTSFYLIHKVMSWVDAWGSMNEDEIGSLIERLEVEKDENMKMTLVLAKAYSDKTSKPVKNLLALMKQETWLTADEAKEWGFVDEVYNSTVKLNIARMSEKFNMLGLPELPGGSAEDSLVKKIVNGVRVFLSSGVDGRNCNLNTVKMDVFRKVNSVLKVNALESTDGKGVYLNEAQLRSIEEALNERDRRIGEHQGHETNYSAAVEKLNGLHPDVKDAEGLDAKIDVLAAKLAQKPGVPAAGVVNVNGKGSDESVDWETMNKLDHMNPKPGEIV